MVFHAAARRYELLHQEAPYHDGTFESWSKEPSLSHPFRYDDGVRITLSRLDLTPDDDFLGQSRPEQADGQVGESADKSHG